LFALAARCLFYSSQQRQSIFFEKKEKMKTKKLNKKTVNLQDGRYLVYYSWAKAKKSSRKKKKGAK